MSRLQLMKRDHALLVKLGDYGLLNTRQIEEMFFKGIRSTTVLRRLRRLEYKGYLIRTESSPYVWTVSDQHLKFSGFTPYGPVNRSILQHEVAISTVRWAMERTGLSQVWKAGHVLRKKTGKTSRKNNQDYQAVPDGVFAVKSDGEYKTVALELELHAKGRARYRNVFYAYMEKRNIWKLWYVVPNDRVGQNILEKAPPAFHQKRPGYMFA